MTARNKELKRDDRDLDRGSLDSPRRHFGQFLVASRQVDLNKKSNMIMLAMSRS